MEKYYWKRLYGRGTTRKRGLHGKGDYMEKGTTQKGNYTEMRLRGHTRKRD